MQPEGESPFRKIGIFAIVPIVIVAVLFIVVAFLRGMVWASEKALPWLVKGSTIAFYVCILVLLPLCIFRKTRPWAGLAFYCASFLFGAMLFAFSCLVVVDIWGYGGLGVGLIFAGVGVVPVALLATLIHAEWYLLLEIVFGLFLTFGTRALGIRLSMTGPKTEGEAHLEDDSAETWQ